MATAKALRSTSTGETHREAQEMLALSLLSYRGFVDPSISFISRSILRSGVAHGMGEWPLLEGWEVVWGPAIHQAPLTIFDDDVVFVARHAATRRYAVVIRGTNPVDLIDWMLGDFLVANLLEWPLDTSAAPGAAVSVSAYRGLMYLLHLQAGHLDRVWDRTVGAVVDPARRLLTGSLRLIDPLLDRVLEAPGRVTSTLEARTVRRRTRRRPFAQRLDLLHQVWRRAARTADGAEPVSARLDRLWDWASLAAVDAGVFPQRVRPGITLIDYLRREVAGTDRARVIVTGHSKGGALAPVLALWLAQTQGPRVQDRPGVAWDPDRRAEVSCHAFAGPTPGNAAFADLYDEVLQDGGHRYANRIDVAPHAWATTGDGLHLGRVGRLYGGAVADHPLLTALVGTITRVVEHNDYAHPGRDVHILPGRSRPGLDLAGQLLHQHLAAYVDLMGLTGEIDALEAIV